MQSELLTNKLAEKVCKNRNSTERLLELTCSSEAKSSLIENETDTFVTNEEVDSSSTASEDASITRRENICRHMRNIVKVKHHRKMVMKSKKLFPSTSPSQSEIGTKYASSVQTTVADLDLSKREDPRRSKRHETKGLDLNSKVKYLPPQCS